MPTELDLAYEHCRRVARAQATNFYYAFRTLPKRQRRAIYAAYAFCRLCDDIADEDLPLDEKRRRFAETREMLRQSGTGGTADSPVFVALGGAQAEFGIPTRLFEEVIEGVEMDLVRSRFDTFDELREYCYKVASVVGLICIEVFGYEDPDAREYAVDMGLAMQLTNILRDVREDAERGRIYLPLDEMAACGYTEDELFRWRRQRALPRPDEASGRPGPRLLREQREADAADRAAVARVPGGAARAVQPRPRPHREARNTTCSPSASAFPGPRSYT